MQGTGATPGYGLNYSSRSLKLAGVKHDVFNPRLPKIRQMDRDSNMHLLSDEHCRTSTTLGSGESSAIPIESERLTTQALRINDHKTILHQ